MHEVYEKQHVKRALSWHREGLLRSFLRSRFLSTAAMGAT